MLLAAVLVDDTGVGVPEIWLAGQVHRRFEVFERMHAPSSEQVHSWGRHRSNSATGRPTPDASSSGSALPARPSLPPVWGCGPWSSPREGLSSWPKQRYYTRLIRVGRPTVNGCRLRRERIARPTPISGSRYVTLGP